MTGISAIAEANATTKLISTFVFTLYNGEILVWRIDSKDPILDVTSEDGVREVPLQVPSGFVFVAMVPSNDRWGRPFPHPKHSGKRSIYEGNVLLLRVASSGREHLLEALAIGRCSTTPGLRRQRKLHHLQSGQKQQASPAQIRLDRTHFRLIRKRSKVSF
jgi:hypothetical protein